MGRPDQYLTKTFGCTEEETWKVARSFMQSIPQTRELDSPRPFGHPISIVCLGEDEARDVYDDRWLSRVYRI